MEAPRLRPNATARLRRLHEEDDFDREFWRAVPPDERLAMVWEMALEYLAWMDPNASEPRLQRTVCRVERKRR